MSFVDFIGFIISFLALFILFFKRQYEKRKRAENPQEYDRKAREREKAIRKFMLGSEEQEEEMEEEEEEDEWEETPHVAKRAPPPPPVLPRPKRPSPQQPSIQYTSKPQKIIEASRKYEVERVLEPSRGASLLRKLSSKQDMIIMHEIFDKPLSLRGERDDIS